MTIKQKLTDWYNAKIVKGWYKTWTVWLSVIALVGPDLLQIALDNADTFFTAVPLLSDTAKAQLRIVLLVFIPVARALKQANLPKETLPVAVVNVPAVVELNAAGMSSVEVPTEVVVADIERSRAEPGPPA